MNARRRLLGLVVCFAALTGLVLAANPDSALAQPKKDKKDNKKDKKVDPKKNENYLSYLKQLNARFTAWDMNKDGFLDTRELAKAFRGADAKPFDKIKVDVPPPPPPPEIVETLHRTKPTTRSVVLASLASPCMVNYALAEMMTWKGFTRTLAKTPVQPLPVLPDYTKFGDYQFMHLVGGKKSKDNKVSRQEFDAWAKTYAHKLDEYEDAMKAMKLAQGNFTKAKTQQAKQKALTEAKRHQAEVQQALSQLNTIPSAIHLALKIKQ